MKNTEKKLYNDLLDLAHKILKLKNSDDITILKKNAHSLCEKLSVLDFVRRQQFLFPSEETLIKETDILTTQITQNESVKSLPKQTIPLEKPTMPKTKKTSKEFENTLPIEEGLRLFGQKNNNPPPLKKTATPPLKQKRDSIRIDLNDRIGFVKNLFDDNLTVFMDFCEELRNFENFKQAKEFIKRQHHKPSWGQKNEYAKRLFDILEKYYI